MIVLDASLMVARLLKEPHPGIHDDLYVLLDANQVLVPSDWAVEVANALRTNVRRGRIKPSDVEVIVGLLSKFQLLVSPPLLPSSIGTLAAFAIARDLTCYDAAYLRIALEQGAALATVDQDMRAAATRLDIQLLPA